MKVIFIAGMGRSGSTLLDRLLGAVPGVCSVGELRWIWTLGFRDNQLCGCGARFLDCPFWTSVVGEAFGGARLDHSAIARRQDRLLRLKWAPLLAVGRRPGKRLSEAFAEFEGAHRRLYQAIASVSGAAAGVDSSKFPPYGLALRGMPGLDLRTVHLVRDSRATAYSVSRERDPSVEGRRAYAYRRGAGAAAINWLLLNGLTEVTWLRRSTYIRVRYEDLSLSPEAHVQRILDFAELPGAAPTPTGGGAYELGIQHTLAGNPMRMEQGPVEIRPDVAWKRSLPRRAKCLASVLSAPGLLRYRYW